MYVCMYYRPMYVYITIQRRFAKYHFTSSIKRYKQPKKFVNI